MDRDWGVIQKALVETAEEIVPNERKGRRQPWMTEEILNMMEERRELKGVSQESYKEMDRGIKIACKIRREEWLGEKCQEVEALERIDARLMAEKIREITGEKRTGRSTVIKSTDGQILMEKEEVLGRWQQYVGDLYRDSDRGRMELGESEGGPGIEEI